MTETITACENVCRDFWSWWPAMWAWLADVGTFLVGMAAVVAFFTYRHQKKLERDAKVDDEKRQAYKDFIAAAEGYFWELVQVERAARAQKKDHPMPSVSYVKLEVAKSQMIMQASNEMIEDAATHLQHLKDYHGLTRNFLLCGADKRGDAKENCVSAYTAAVKSRIAVLERARSETIGAGQRLKENSAVIEKFYRLPSEEELQ